MLVQQRRVVSQNNTCKVAQVEWCGGGRDMTPRCGYYIENKRFLSFAHYIKS